MLWWLSAKKKKRKLVGIPSGRSKGARLMYLGGGFLFLGGGGGFCGGFLLGQLHGAGGTCGAVSE